VMSLDESETNGESMPPFASACPRCRVLATSNLEENSTSVSEAATAAVACDVSPIVAT
ncbi:hypothetical protein ALC56_00696, partial [Trachymyrmex septentrionalis]